MALRSVLGVQPGSAGEERAETLPGATTKRTTESWSAPLQRMPIPSSLATGTFSGSWIGRSDDADAVYRDELQTFPRRGWSNIGRFTPHGAIRLRIFLRNSGNTVILSWGVWPPSPASQEWGPGSFSAGVALPPSRASQRLR